MPPQEPEGLLDLVDQNLRFGSHRLNTPASIADARAGIANPDDT
jgi:hypothetical protein